MSATSDAECRALETGYSVAALAQMEQLLSDLGRLYRERNEALLEVASAQRETLMRLARAAELRDDDTGVHIVRMGHLCAELAMLMGESEAYAALLRHAAPMHDVGKIGISDSVLKKPGPLTAEERTEMQKHPLIGAEIIGGSQIELFRLAAELAASHHERWDGRGYPHGLAGEAIPLSGRIVAVIDVLDALTMDRCYRPAFTDAQALQMIALERGRSFDPRIVDCVLDNAHRLIALRDAVNRQEGVARTAAARDASSGVV